MVSILLELLLRGAKLSGAGLKETTFGATDLSELGDELKKPVFRTIQKSWPLPKSFPRGWWVEDETAKALEKERELKKQEGGKIAGVLIPLNLDGFMFKREWRSGFKSTLTKKLASDFTGWEKDNAKFESEFENIVKALRPRGKSVASEDEQ